MAAGANCARATPLPPPRHGRPRATGAARLLDKRRLEAVPGEPVLQILARLITLLLPPLLRLLTIMFRKTFLCFERAAKEVCGHMCAIAREQAGQHDGLSSALHCSQRYCKHNKLLNRALTIYTSTILHLIP